MLFDLIQLFLRPEEYVFNWRDGELYIEPVETSENNKQAEETIERRAA